MIYLSITLYFVQKQYTNTPKPRGMEKNNRPMPLKIIDEEDIQIYHSKYRETILKRTYWQGNFVTSPNGHVKNSLKQILSCYDTRSPSRPDMLSKTVQAIAKKSSSLQGIVVSNQFVKLNISKHVSFASNRILYEVFYKS